VVHSQRALIHGWLAQDYIRQWIHGQGLQNTLNGLEKFLEHQARSEGLGRQSRITHHWIGYDGDKPFVYLLTTNVIDPIADEYAKYRESNKPAITLDIFIGDKDYVGKGLATAIIMEFLLSQFPDVGEIFIDPEKSNTRAVHVYQKAGFRIIGEFIASWHLVPHHIMRLDMRDLIKNTYNINYRSAEAKDLAAANQLIRASKAHWGYPDDFMKRFMQLFGLTEAYLSENTIELMLDGDKIIGLYGFKLHPDNSLELDYFFIHPAYIGKGFGKTLWDRARQCPKQFNMHSFILWSDPEAETFYVKMGCHRIGMKKSPLLPNREAPVLQYDLEDL
jgi:streptomycin 6-kinase